MSRLQHLLVDSFAGDRVGHSIAHLFQSVAELVEIGDHPWSTCRQMIVAFLLPDRAIGPVFGFDKHKSA